MEKVAKVKINYQIVQRRFGDTKEVIADSSLARKLIKWNPKSSDLETIIRSTWKIYKN